MAGSTSSSHVARPRVTVVHSAACHFCDDAQDALAQIAREVPLDVELVDAGSARGAGLIREHGAAMLPLVLLDGAFFSSGRLPRGKLRHVVTAASRATATPSLGVR